jgi:two-component system sensor histidine kinase FlrB
MLPSSHPAPINASLANKSSGAEDYERVLCLHDDGGGHRQEDSRDESEIRAGSAALLAGEFTEFIAAASRLEVSYRELQEEVSALGLELSERNAALNTSLAENERMRLALQQIVDSMPCGVLVLDRRGKISMINPESRRLLGLDQVHFETGSQPTLRQISLISGVNLEASYKSALSGATELEFCVRDSSGKRWIEVRNRRIVCESVQGNELDQTILILRDVTAQKRAEQEREAGRKAMALAEITTILAHEIRNPLASLELFAELIEKDEGRRGEWIPNLRAGIRSLSGTVNNVLSFHGSGSLKLSPVSLPALIGRAIQFVQPLADQAEVSLKWLAGHDRIQVSGNESGVQQLVLNLVSNAIHHTPAGGCVTVALKSEQNSAQCENHGKNSERVMVEFSDTGCGIRSDQIDHVFEPGFSGRGDTSGLGLAVCERIMKQHGGKISVSNIVNSGARFTLLFPVLEAKPSTS